VFHGPGSAPRLRTYINNDLAGSGSAFDCGMSLLDRIETEMAGIEARHDLARLYQLCGFAHCRRGLSTSFSFDIAGYPQADGNPALTLTAFAGRNVLKLTGFWKS